MSERFKLIPAVYLILKEGNKILLLQRQNTGYQDGKYSLIAGHLDGGELATSAAVREAKEEANLTISPDNLKLVHISHRLNKNQVGQERIDLFFEVNSWQGEIKNMEPEKCGDLNWFDIDNLPEQMLPFIKIILEKYSNGEFYSEFLTEPI